MRATGKRIVIIALGILSLSVFPLLSLSGHEHGSHQEEGKSPAHEGHGTSPLIEEMIQLDAVFRDVVSGVALGDGKRVHAAIETMHGAMEKTHEGVHAGTVTLKKNAHRLNDFVAQDKRFHEKLEQLSHAAHKNKRNAMLTLTKELLDGCVKCHLDFREP